MQNVEYKVELRRPDVALGVCRLIGASEIGEIEVVDTYFRVPRGRLKKRQAPGEPTEFVYYERIDRIQPKACRFTIYSEAAAVERFGAAPMPVLRVVRKRRRIFMIGNIRIHLDHLEGVGHFLELEAMISRDQPERSCRESLRDLINLFRPVLGEPVSCGYAELATTA